MGYPESGLAIPLGWVSLPLCVQLVGPARAKRWLMSGDRLPAAVLEQWGFLDEIAAPDTLMDRAREMAAAYAGRRRWPSR